jgi:hypothetical protein
MIKKWYEKARKIKPTDTQHPNQRGFLFSHLHFVSKSQKLTPSTPDLACEASTLTTELSARA